MSWERETIINFAEQVDEADIYTHSEKWINRLEKIGIKPYKEYESGAKSYKIPKSLLKLPRAKSTISDERRKMSSERMKKLQEAKRKAKSEVE